MPGLFRDPRLALALALALPFAVASGCTMDNPLFKVGSGTTTELGGSTGVMSATGTLSGPETTGNTDPTLGPTTGTTVDPGTTAATSTSTTGMSMGFCGDGTIDPGELCDDGPNNGPGMPCNADCSTPGCGDSILDGVEECDDGNMIDEDSCLSTCVLAICGDGHILDGVEGCDDGNGANNDACTNDCFVNVCGDDVLNEDVEQCDDGNTDPGDGCSNFCLLEICGNGKVDINEACDDGNLDDGDNCTSKCTLPVCGDGLVQIGEEACDDGNMIETDQCTSFCKQGPCGDGLFDPKAEPCDFKALPFKDHQGLCSDACELNVCFKLKNTDLEDFNDPEWFKPCVDKIGSKVHIAVFSATKQVLYIASGDKDAWNYDALTSDAAPNLQFDLATHLPIILDNKDKLFITGTSSMPPAQASCIQTLGDGYGLVVRPPAGDGFKLLLAPYKGKSGKPRLFTGWTANHELSYNAAGMPLCLAPGPTAAPLNSTIVIAVSD